MIADTGAPKQNMKKGFRRPILFGSSFRPEKGENRMSNAGDVLKAREDFLKKKPVNLTFLLEKRYGWMNRFIDACWTGIEVGCGPGLSRQYIKCKNFILTDLSDNYWVEQKVNALKMPFSDSALDFIISSNMIHHLSRPYDFFAESSRVLKKGGRLIIQEVNCSLLMRMILKIMRHEGYDYSPDVFNKDSICNNDADPWSANCAIPNLLFDDLNKFESEFSCFKPIYHKYSECFIFPLSGGVIAKHRTVNLPKAVLKCLDCLDEALIAVSKGVFPLQRRIVLENIK